MPTARKKPIEILTPDEFGLLVAQCSRRARSGIRDAALLWVIYGAALRVSEALTLVAADVDVGKQEVRVRSGKGSKERLVALHGDALPWLERWAAIRAGLPRPRKGPLFCTISATAAGGPLSRQAVDVMLKRRAAKAGIEKRCHAHALRHAMALRMATKVPVMLVQKQLGHSSLAVTTEYLSHLTAEDLVDAMRGV